MSIDLAIHHISGEFSSMNLVHGGNEICGWIYLYILLNSREIGMDMALLLFFIGS